MIKVVTVTYVKTNVRMYVSIDVRVLVCCLCVVEFWTENCVFVSKYIFPNLIHIYGVVLMWFHFLCSFCLIEGLPTNRSANWLCACSYDTHDLSFIVGFICFFCVFLNLQVVVPHPLFKCFRVTTPFLEFGYRWRLVESTG